MFFRDRSNLRTPDCPTFEFDDRDGDTCCIQFYSDGEGECGLVELQIYSDTGCATFTKEQALALAHKIIEQAK